MGIFDRIKGAIFGKAHAAPAPTTAETPAGQPATTAGASPAVSAAPAPGAAPSAAPATTAGAPAGPVDVAQILDEAVRKSGQKLDWRKSIVDLMKALGMDASLAERKELADELGYSGDKNDSATMNVWLHKQLLQKLSENGGKIPANLLN